MEFDMDITGLPPQVAEQAQRVKDYLETTEGAQIGEPGEAPAQTAEPSKNNQPENALPKPEGTIATTVPDSQQQSTAANLDYTALLEAAEQRHRVLQGKYSAEVPRLSQRIRELEAELESLRVTRQSNASDGQAGSSTNDTTFNAMSVDELDEQLESARLEGDFDKVKLLRSEIRARDRQEIAKEFEPFRQQAAISADERYVSDLNMLASGWEKHRADPSFADFLQQPAPFTGTPLFEILNQADHARDAVRVSEVYKAFEKQKQTASSDSATPQPRQLPSSLIAPAKSVGGGGVVTQQTVTEAQLSQAAQEVQKGKRTPESYALLESAYFRGLVT